MSKPKKPVKKPEQVEEAVEQVEEAVEQVEEAVEQVEQAVEQVEQVEDPKVMTREQWQEELAKERQANSQQFAEKQKEKRENRQKDFEQVQEIEKELSKSAEKLGEKVLVLYAGKSTLRFSKASEVFQRLAGIFAEFDDCQDASERMHTAKETLPCFFSQVSKSDENLVSRKALDLVVGLMALGNSSSVSPSVATQVMSELGFEGSVFDAKASGTINLRLSKKG